MAALGYVLFTRPCPHCHPVPCRWQLVDCRLKLSQGRYDEDAGDAQDGHIEGVVGVDQ